MPAKSSLEGSGPIPSVGRRVLACRGWQTYPCNERPSEAPMDFLRLIRVPLGLFSKGPRVYVVYEKALQALLYHAFGAMYIRIGCLDLIRLFQNHAPSFGSPAWCRML